MDLYKSLEQLENCSRKELQKLCKQVNPPIKANIKTVDMVAKLNVYFSQVKEAELAKLRQEEAKLQEELKQQEAELREIEMMEEEEEEKQQVTGSSLSSLAMDVVEPQQEQEEVTGDEEDDDDGLPMEHVKRVLYIGDTEKETEADRYYAEVDNDNYARNSPVVKAREAALEEQQRQKQQEEEEEEEEEEEMMNESDIDEELEAEIEAEVEAVLAAAAVMAPEDEEEEEEEKEEEDNNTESTKDVARNLDVEMQDQQENDEEGTGKENNTLNKSNLYKDMLAQLDSKVQKEKDSGRIQKAATRSVEDFLTCTSKGHDKSAKKNNKTFNKFDKIHREISKKDVSIVDYYNDLEQKKQQSSVLLSSSSSKKTSKKKRVSYNPALLHSAVKNNKKFIGKIARAAQRSAQEFMETLKEEQPEHAQQQQQQICSNDTEIGAAFDPTSSSVSASASSSSSTSEDFSIKIKKKKTGCAGIMDLFSPPFKQKRKHKTIRSHLSKAMKHAAGCKQQVEGNQQEQKTNSKANSSSRMRRGSMVMPSTMIITASSEAKDNKTTKKSHVSTRKRKRIQSSCSSSSSTTNTSSIPTGKRVKRSHNKKMVKSFNKGKTIKNKKNLKTKPSSSSSSSLIDTNTTGAKAKSNLVIRQHKRYKFDLKASLKRAPTWKMKKGKIDKENVAPAISVAFGTKIAQGNNNNTNNNSSNKNNTTKKSSVSKGGFVSITKPKAVVPRHHKANFTKEGRKNRNRTEAASRQKSAKSDIITRRRSGLSVRV